MAEKNLHTKINAFKIIFIVQHMRSWEPKIVKKTSTGFVKKCPKNHLCKADQQKQHGGFKVRTKEISAVKKIVILPLSKSGKSGPFFAKNFYRRSVFFQNTIKYKNIHQNLKILSLKIMRTWMHVFPSHLHQLRLQAKPLKGSWESNAEQESFGYILGLCGDCMRWL